MSRSKTKGERFSFIQLWWRNAALIRRNDNMATKKKTAKKAMKKTSTKRKTSMKRKSSSKKSRR